MDTTQKHTKDTLEFLKFLKLSPKEMYEYIMKIYGIDIKQDRERLNPETPKGDAIV